MRRWAVFVLTSGLFVAAFFLPTAWNLRTGGPILGYEALYFAVYFGGVFWIPGSASFAFAIGQIAYLRRVRKPAQSMAVTGFVLNFLGLPIMLYYDVAIAYGYAVWVLSTALFAAATLVERDWEA